MNQDQIDLIEDLVLASDHKNIVDRHDYELGYNEYHVQHLDQLRFRVTEMIKDARAKLYLK